MKLRTRILGLVWLAVPLILIIQTGVLLHRVADGPFFVLLGWWLLVFALPGILTLSGLKVGWYTMASISGFVLLTVLVGLAHGERVPHSLYLGLYFAVSFVLLLSDGPSSWRGATRGRAVQ